MILFYALGGGWGHLKRVSVFARNYGVKDLKVLTASPVAFHLFKEDQVVLVDRKFEKDPVGFAGFLDQLIRDAQPERMIVDVFPNGILGELQFLGSSLPMDLLCRHMKWEAYSQKAVSGVHYDKAYILEELHPDQATYLNEICSELREIGLEYPELPMETDPFSYHPAWLIVHGSSGAELKQLIDGAVGMAQKQVNMPKIYVCSDRDPSIQGITYLGPMEASRYLRFADRIFTGAGFNIMQETIRYRDKQVILPFPRRYDDQQLRKDQMGA